MSKRGGLPQMGKDGDFNGSGMQDEAADPPVRATAAQMAARKIKTPKGRGFGRSNSQAPTAPVFNQISGNAQTNGTGMSFGAQAQGAGFNMSFPSGNAGQNASGVNGVNQGFSGTFFNLPGSTNQNQPAPSSQSTMFNSQPSSFNFGGGSSTQQQGSSGFTFGQQPQSNGTTNGQTNGNVFGASTAAPSQAPFGGFSTPAPKQNDNPFGMTSQAPAPQTAPAQPSNPFGGASQSTSQPFNFFGASQATPSQPSQNPFGASSTKPASQGAFGASQPSPEETSPADHSMISPPRQEAPKSFFTAPTPSTSTSTPSLFAGFGQNKAKEATAPATTATTSTPAASTTSAFGGFGSSDKAESAASTPKPASSFFPASTTNAEASVFDTQPKATFSSSFFSSPAPTATPAQAPTPNLFSPAKPQEAAPSIFSPSKPADKAPNMFSSMKPAETAPNTQTPKPAASFFAPTSSTSPFKSTTGLDFSTKSTEIPAPSTQEHPENVSVFSGPPTSMSTLNSAASPATLPGPRDPGEQTYDAPPAPTNYNENERGQWHWSMQLKSLDRAVHSILTRPDSHDTDRVIIYEWAAREAGRMQKELKRYLDEATVAQDAAPASNLGAPRNPFASNSTPSVSKPATALESSTSTNLFAPSSNIFGAASNKRKSDNIDREREDGSQDTSKKSRTAETSSSSEVTYPELSTGSSQTSQLFGSIAGVSQTPSQQNNLFGLAAPKTTTPAGSPLKAPAAEKPTTTGPQLSLPQFAPSAGPTDFFAQFAKNSEKSEAEAAKKRKDEEFDSDDDDPEEWAKADKERAEKKKAELAEAAKSAPKFLINPSATPSRTPSPFEASGKSTVSKPQDSNIFGASTTASKPSNGSIFDGAGKNTFAGFGTPAKTTDASSKSTGNPLFDRSTSSTTNLFGQSTADHGAQDNTFKGDDTTPIKFSATPSINFTASTPEKAATNGIASNLFSKSLPGSSSFGGTSLFPNKNAFSQSLAPGSVTSETSRATSPGTTGDEGGDDDAAPAEEQVNLTAATAGEEDEDVLIDLTGRGQVLVTDPETKAKKWETRGKGQIKLLCHKNTKQTRIVLRTSPAGKIVLNVNLIPGMKYAFNSAKQDIVTFMVMRPELNPPVENWALTVPKGEGAELHKLIEENKKNTSA